MYNPIRKWSKAPKAAARGARKRISRPNLVKPPEPEVKATQVKATEVKVPEAVPAKPIVAGKKPAVLDLEPGTYYWCRCGRSKDGAFCDGSHKGTGITPLEFKVEEKTKMAICLCKATCDQPRCDSSHSRL